MQARPLSAAAAHALLHVTVFVWGFTAILGRSISIRALPLVFYRLAMVVVALGALVLVRRVRWTLTAATFRALLVAGALVAFHWILFYGCIKTAGVAVAVICLSTGTFFTACFEPIVFRRKPHAGELLIGLAVVAGVSLLVKLETHATSLGLAMGLFSAFFSALFGTINGRAAQRARAELVSLVELATAFVVTGLFLLARPGDFVAPSALSPRDLALLLLLAIGCTVLPWLWVLRVLGTLSPYTVSLAVALEPVYSIALAWVLFPDAEQLHWRFYAGAALLVLMVLLNGWMKRPSAQPQGLAPPALEQ
jgi:drug/metabolite transporter (DMT)-like permease